MDTFLMALESQAASICIRIILAIFLFFVGRILIRTILGLLKKNKFFTKTDGAVQTFTLSLTHIGLYLVLIICVIGILGVPMASIAALITSGGVAIGLGFQGALANLAGGIMLIIFRPFKLGDYIEATGITGIADEINLFYTVIITLDGKRVTIPNGTLMNTNITDYTTQGNRRVELKFTCARTENPTAVQKIMQNTITKEKRVLYEPELPFVSISASTNEAYEFIVRVWCTTEDYLNVYYALTQNITEALSDAGVKAPAVRITS